MPRKKTADAIALAVGAPYSEAPARELKHQSRYGSEPWKPGEIPRQPLRTMIAATPDRPAYGEENAVQPAYARGSTVKGAVGKPEKP